MEPICMEYLYGTYMYGYLFRFVYRFVGYETLLTLSLPMFGLKEPYLCIKFIFVSFSSVLGLVLSFGWKFRVKRGKLAEIAGEYRYSNLFLVQRILSTSTKS